MRAVILGLLVACGSSQPTPVVVENAAPAPDAGPLAAGCPATFGEAQGACDWQEHRNQCNYAEGSCYCGVTPVCSGVAMNPEDEASRPTYWQCAATPPAVRADGCPGVLNTGAACRDAGKRCTYGDCCVTVVECRGGTWAHVDSQCPP